jgi:Cu/Zn superoxide dismutase
MTRAMQWGMAAIAVTMVAGAATLGAQAPVKVDMKDGQGQSIGTATVSSAMGAVHIQLDLKGLKPGPSDYRSRGRPPLLRPAGPSAGPRRRGSR